MFSLGTIRRMNASYELGALLERMDEIRPGYFGDVVSEIEAEWLYEYADAEELMERFRDADERFVAVMDALEAAGVEDPGAQWDAFQAVRGFDEVFEEVRQDYYVLRLNGEDNLPEALMDKWTEAIRADLKDEGVDPDEVGADEDE